MEKRWIANPNVKEVDFLDIRIEKTERAIKQAFMELRAEKPLEKIRVKELCDRACINKSTFYAHYQDIYALALNQLPARYAQPGTIVVGDPVRDEDAVQAVMDAYDTVAARPKL